MKKKSDKKIMSLNAFTAEHEKLLQILREGTKKEREEEAKEQEKELKGKK